MQLSKKIKSGHLDRIPSQYTDELMKVIREMISLDPHMRPSAEKLLEHR
jgi:2-hydroxy-3-keto-5-methylthiopentenyl-1-phosphate phosphatase